MVLRTVDRVVRRNVQVVQIRGNGETLRNVGEVAVLGRSHHLDLAVAFGLLDGFLGPYARIHVTRLPAEEVGRHLVEEGAGAAPQIDDPVVVGNGQQFAEEPVGLLHHGIELLRTMRDRKHGESRSVEVEHGLGRIFDHLVRQDRRSCIEIVLFHNVT